MMNTEPHAQFVFGIEREHRPALLAADGTISPNDESIDEEIVKAVIRDVCRSRTPWVYTRKGIFTSYGRLYHEIRNHLETALIPASTPDDVIKTEGKWDRLLQTSLKHVRVHFPTTNLLNNNLNYSCGTTAGQHESYGIRHAVELLRPGMLPFLVTRQVFCGSGYISLQRSLGLSPRAHFITQETGGDTTGNRAIYSTARQEPLMCIGDHTPFRMRLHLILGDALKSQYAQWLKVGVTALVLRAVEENPSLGDPVAFSNPVDAIRDLSLSLAPELKGADMLPEVLTRVQYHYLREVGQMLDRFAFPEWCGRIWEEWRRTIDALAKDPDTLGSKLDWVIKHRLYSSFLARRSKRWSHVCNDHDLFWALALLDVQYHAVLDSLFERLDVAGVLDHRLFSEEETTPGHEEEPWVPADLPRETSRARLIKRYTGTSAQATWTTFFADADNMWVLDDPFEEARPFSELTSPVDLAQLHRLEGGEAIPEIIEAVAHRWMRAAQQQG